MGSAGACDPCGTPANIAPEDKKLWTCDENGDISLDLKGSQSALKCMSWSTEGSCEFKQKDLRALQVTLESKNCDDLWVAPLWMCPSEWVTPQHKTGEVDFFERGCSIKDGYLLSFGESSPWIIDDVWGEKGTNNTNNPSSFTALLTFDPTADEVCAYKCPKGSDPLRDGTTLAGCTRTMTHPNYYLETQEQTNNGNEYMHLVSDIWNKCPSLNCGKAKKLSSDCEFHISGLKLRFSDEAANHETNSPFKQPENPSCSNIWYRPVGQSPGGTGPSPPPPWPLSPFSEAPSSASSGSLPWYDDTKTLFGVTAIVVAIFFVVMLALRKNKKPGN
jgi:hypothetical protein